MVAVNIDGGGAKTTKRSREKQDTEFALKADEPNAGGSAVSSKAQGQTREGNGYVGRAKGRLESAESRGAESELSLVMVGEETTVGSFE